MGEEVKLKPCPYCGSAPRIEHHFSKDEYRYCCCSNPSCPSNLPSLTDEAAYENWNTRPIEDELQAKLDAIYQAFWNLYKLDMGDSYVVSMEGYEELWKLIDPLSYKAFNPTWEESKEVKE